MRDYAKKSSLVDEAKRRVGMEAKRLPTKRLGAPAKLSAPKTKKSEPIKLSWSRLPKRVKSIIVAVVIIVVVGWIIYHIPFARIGHTISEKTHGLGKSVHQNVAQVTTEKPVTSTGSVPQKITQPSQINQANNGLAADPTQNLATSAASNTAEKSAAKPVAPPEAKPVFDFYTVLPARNGGGPSTATVQNTNTTQQSAASRTVTAATASVASTPTNSGTSQAVLLEVGSFANPNDADKMRAQFLLAGLNPTINKAANGRYRVVFGPFTSSKDAEGMRAKINKANVSGVVVQTLAQ